ncbi:MAG: RidA family protein [Alphaproteobacteria bacterium]
MTKIESMMVPGQMEPMSHFCHVVRAGNLVWLSGAVGVRADGSIPADTVEQFRVAIANLDACLKHAGGSPEHIVKVNIYLTDVNDRARINPVRQEYFGAHRPTSTLVGVSALALPALTVEIEAQAVVP